MLTRWNIAVIAVGCIVVGASPVGAYEWVRWSTSEGGNGHEYALITQLMEFSQAEAVAVSQGGHLATVNSQAENDWIVSMFNAPPTDNYVMVGLADAGHEGQWTWASGEPVTFLGWYTPDEPNGGTSENHCVLYTRGPLVGYWADVDDGPPGGQYGLIERAVPGEIKVVFPGPDIPVLCPGNRYAIGWWTSPGIEDVKIDLYYLGGFEKTLVARTPNDGKWTWAVPAVQHLNSDYRIRVSVADDTTVFADSQEFGVGTCPPFACLQMKYPFDDARNETAVQGNPFPVTWSNCLPAPDSVRVELWYLDQVEAVLADGVPNTGYFVWEVPADQHLNSDYRIVIVDVASPRHKAATTEFSVKRDTAWADVDGDGDVDLSDFTGFVACFNGPNQPPVCR